jgi:hypothetical protein
VYRKILAVFAALFPVSGFANVIYPGYNTGDLIGTGVATGGNSAITAAPKCTVVGQGLQCGGDFVAGWNVASDSGAGFQSGGSGIYFDLSYAGVPGVPVQPYAINNATNLAGFPATGAASTLYIDTDTGTAYVWNGTNYAVATPTNTLVAANKYLVANSNLIYIWDAGSNKYIAATLPQGIYNSSSITNIENINVAGSLLNEQTLILAPGDHTNATEDRIAWIGGAILNGTLDGKTFDDNAGGGVANSRLVVEASAISVGGKIITDNQGYASTAAFPATGAPGVVYTDNSDGRQYTYVGGSYVAYDGRYTVAILNAGEKVITGTALGGHTSVADSESMSLKTLKGDITLGGSVWNNAYVDASGNIVIRDATNAGSVQLGLDSAANVNITGDVVNFGGHTNIRAGQNIAISGNVSTNYGTVNFSAIAGRILMGDVAIGGSSQSAVFSQVGIGGITAGNIDISNGYMTVSGADFITVGNISNTTGVVNAMATSVISGKKLTVGGIVNNSKVDMNLASGGGSDLVVGGNIWNNTNDGLTASDATASRNYGNLSLASAGNLSVSGDLVNFGKTAILSAAQGTTITGNILNGYGAMSLASAAGKIQAGNITQTGGDSLVLTQSGVGGITAVNVNITTGYAQLNAADFMSVGNISNTTATSLANNTSFITGAVLTAGDITQNSANKMVVSAGGNITAGQIANTTGVMDMTTAANGILNATGVNVAAGRLTIAGANSLMLGTGGLTVSGNAYLNGGGSTTAGDLYLTNNAMTIQTAGDIVLGGALSLASGTGLTIGTATGVYKTVSIGSISNNGVLSLLDSSFNTIGVSGAITSGGTAGNNASVSAYSYNSGGAADNITVGGTITSGQYSSITLVADDNLTTGDVLSNNSLSGNVLLQAKNAKIATGNLQNNAAAGKTFVADAYGDLTITGNVNNTGDFMRLTAGGNIAVSGTMKNDLNTGKLYIGATGKGGTNIGNFALTGPSVSSLTISGGDASHAGLENSGTFYALVSGATTIANGVSIAATATEFFLDTGTLSMPSAGANGLENLLQNKMNYFTMIVRNGDVSGVGITNGTRNGATVENASAAMRVEADNIVLADAVKNVGSDLILKSDGATGITIGGVLYNGTLDGVAAVANAAQKNASLTASGTISIADTVRNFGYLVVNGTNAVNLAAIDNNGTARVESSSAAGAITGTTITNNGTTTGACNAGDGTNCDLYIVARDANFTGAFASGSGNALIQTTNSAAVGGVSLTGGRLDIDAYNGFASNGAIAVNSGSLNFSSNTTTATATGNVATAGDINGWQSGVATGGSMNFAIATGNTASFSTTGNIAAGGNIVANSANAITLQLNGTGVSATGDILAQNRGILKFGPSVASITGELMSTDANATIDWSAVGSGATVAIAQLNDLGKVIAGGASLTADASVDNAINIANGVLMNGATSGGFNILSNNYTLRTTGVGADIKIAANGVNVAASKTLALDSADRIDITGTTTNAGALTYNALNEIAIGAIANTGTLNAAGKSATGGAVSNTGGGNLNIATTNGVIAFGDFTNSAAAVLNSGNQNTTLGAVVNNTGGNITLTAKQLNVNSIASAAAFVVNSATVASSGAITATGNLGQDSGTGTYALQFKTNNLNVAASALNVSGNFVANNNAASYTIANDATITGGLTIATPAETRLTSSTGNIASGVITNNGKLELIATAAAKKIATGAISNSATGDLAINTTRLESGLVANNGVANITAATATVAGLNNAAGKMRLSGGSLESTGAVSIVGQLAQNQIWNSFAAGVDIMSNDYAINLSGTNSASSTLTISQGIDQNSGLMTLKTTVLNITDGGIAANGTVRISANDHSSDSVPASAADRYPWLTANIVGNVSENVQFFGLSDATINGNYAFGDNSILSLAILPKSVENYFATVSLANDNTLGNITDDAGGTSAIVNVSGKFTTDITGSVFSLPSLPGPNTPLTAGQVGFVLNDIVDAGTAVKLLHADGGIEEDGLQMRNLVVRFCNADGSKCFNYLDAFRKMPEDILTSSSPLAGSNSNNDLPAYLTLRDTDGDNVADTMYAVFDPRFGGPVEVFKIQPIVEADPTHTRGEYLSAGALDDMVEDGVRDAGFHFRTPIEAIPVVFAGTNLQTAASELYNRMDQYQIGRDNEILSRFSKLFQQRELGQLSNQINLNEHAVFRSFENRLFEELDWVRNRSRNKFWVDADFSNFTHSDYAGEADIAGERFSISFGADKRVSSDRIIGVAGHVNQSSSNFTDTMNLGYMGWDIDGRVVTDASDLNFGLGAYFIDTRGETSKMYGNLFLDIHSLEINRTQNFVNPISGSAVSISLITEWGILHELLGEYIIGNAYARGGYNFGFDMTTRAEAADYQNLQSRGYGILTPGYSLRFQRKVYTSNWLQIRPRVDVGLEYDLLGIGNDAQYKFAVADNYTKYKVETDPLWMNVGGGIEFVAADGIGVALDYKYSYNQEMRVHNVKVGGHYRF